VCVLRVGVYSAEARDAVVRVCQRPFIALSRHTRGNPREAKSGIQWPCCSSTGVTPRALLLACCRLVAAALSLRLRTQNRTPLSLPRFFPDHCAAAEVEESSPPELPRVHLKQQCPTRRPHRPRYCVPARARRCLPHACASKSATFLLSAADLCRRVRPFTRSEKLRRCFYFAPMPSTRCIVLAEAK